MRNTTGTTWRVLGGLLGAVWVLWGSAGGVWADNAFLSTPRVWVNGAWHKYGPSLGGINAAVTKTVFDMTISYHDTLSADSVPPGDPKRTRALEVEEVIKFWSDALYEQSNGQHMLGTVYIYQGGKMGNKASVLWVATSHPSGLPGGYGKPLGNINFGDVFGTNVFVGATSTATSQANGGYTLGHETGHFVYAMYDEYSANYAPAHFPRSRDVSPSSPAIMNDQWGAMRDNQVRWLNHSTAGNYKASTDTAQKRVYGKSCWEVMLQDPSLDGPNARPVAVWPQRVQYAFGNPPASPDWYRTAVTPGTHLAAAQANLRIVWLSGGMVYQIIIDRSGSMVPDPDPVNPGPSPLDNAKGAARDLVESMAKETAVGVVQFDDGVAQIYPITFIPSDDVGARAVKDATKAAIDGISKGGFTAIYDAASTALANIKTYQGTVSGDLTGACYLLTDGDDNSSSKSSAQVIAEYQAAKIPLVTVGYGSGGAGNPVLSSLADETGGQYFTSPTTQSELQQVFFAAQGSYSDVVNLGNVKKTIAAGVADQALFRVDSTMGSVKFFLNWNGASADLTITVRNPGGIAVPVTPQISQTGGASDYSAEVKAPTPGLWTVHVQNSAAAPREVSFSAVGQPVEGTGFALTVGLANGGSTVTPPDPIRLFATVSKGGVPLAHATVVATITAPSSSTPTLLTLRDDGTGGDAVAGDGTYSALLASYVAGTYKIDVTASNPSGTARESFWSYSPSRPGPGDEGLVFNPDGALAGEDFQRSTSFQVKASGGVTPTVTPTAAPTPTVAPTAAPTVAPTAIPTVGPGGGGGGGGCATGMLAFPWAVVLLVPLLGWGRKP